MHIKKDSYVPVVVGQELYWIIDCEYGKTGDEIVVEGGIEAFCGLMLGNGYLCEKISRESSVKLLNKLIYDDDGDKEFNHIKADNILCKLLVSLGYSDVVDTYKQIPKWYT